MMSPEDMHRQLIGKAAAFAGRLTGERVLSVKVDESRAHVLTATRRLTLKYALGYFAGPDGAPLAGGADWSVWLESEKRRGLMGRLAGAFLPSRRPQSEKAR
jgi:hypothetical protein